MKIFMQLQYNYWYNSFLLGPVSSFLAWPMIFCISSLMTVCISDWPCSERGWLSLIVYDPTARTFNTFPENVQLTLISTNFVH